jgi:hypothetical protein
VIFSVAFLVLAIIELTDIGSQRTSVAIYFANLAQRFFHMMPSNMSFGLSLSVSLTSFDGVHVGWRDGKGEIDASLKHISTTVSTGEEELQGLLFLKKCFAMAYCVGV